ncbi:hypothetical protein ACFP2F_21210 [Hymenobacter artigasi]|uniref:Uncharacterized protein n=1 Tax=Hymenobacter artigasi TaxID=2719616 RepID=A0ABX1HKN8_9BACT|nr:hypothetical protein [Hymenobacter artigasi]NKI89602.1 hypothetical protein [Hymenobacter artigasi]
MRKQLSLLAGLVLLATHAALAQPTVKEGPAGFDQPKAGVATGRLDSISYPSSIVGPVPPV